jgi:hypothetical protein
MDDADGRASAEVHAVQLQFDYEHLSMKAQ